MKKSNITKSMAILACLIGVTTAKAQFDQTAKIVGDYRESRAEFGTSVSLIENFAVVGASREAFASGAAYIYTKDSQGTWGYTQTLAADDPNDGAEFGGAAQFSDDYLVIAAGRADVETTARAGALYVYDYVNGSWDFSTKIVTSDYSGDAKLGMNPTSLDVQGDTIIAGAPGENGWTGSVYVFTKVAGVWEETQKILKPTSGLDETFGIGVSISGDYLLIGAQNVDDRKGAAYIYVKNSSGMYEYEQTIIASDRDIDNFFGSSVNISGEQLVVGAYGANLEQGSAYVFEKDTQGVWTEVQKLNANPSTEAVHFGWMTEIHEDYIVISAPHIYGYEPGEVYFYKKDSSGTWVEEQIIQGNDTAGEDFYGWSIALHESELIVGSNREDHDETGNNEISDAGAAYIFEDPSLLGGLSEDTFTNMFTVSPVPAKDVITVSSTTNFISKVTVINELGMKIKEETFVASTNHSLDISNIAQGIYFLYLEGENGEKTTKKFIKN